MIKLFPWLYAADAARRKGWGAGRWEGAGGKLDG